MPPIVYPIQIRMAISWDPFSLSFFDSIKQINPKGCGAVKRRSVAKTLSEFDPITILSE